MSIEYGFESPIWMSKAIVAQAPPLLLRKAVCEMIDMLNDRGSSGVSPFELIDLLIQVSTVGVYTPSEDKDVVARASFPLEPDGTISPEQEREIQKFIERLNGIPSAEQTDDEIPYKDWLKKMGIPDIDDYSSPEEEDDDKE